MTKTRAALGALVLTAVAGSATAANFDWMSYAPTPFLGSFPSGSVFNLTGIGAVTVTYSANPNFSDARVDQPNFANGSAGPYSWNPVEVFGRTHVNSAPLVDSWNVTYTFAGTIPAGDLVLGISGLGRRDDPIGGTPGAVSTATVLQNGTFMGEWFGTGSPKGANLFTPGPGIFTLENSVTGVGGADPWWNTALACIRIDDAVSSLTVRIDQTAGDGVGVNIGTLVPTPSAAALLGLGAVPMLSRRRRV